tara:strand:+ start:718 stop:1296 length:579 start_codon:yes stop_codon:yes gene_type:complete
MTFLVPAAVTAVIGTTAATVVGGVVAAGAIAGVAGTVKAGKAAKKSAQLQQRAQELQQKRQRRAAIRSNMIASARARASAQAAGVVQSSGLQGAVGSGRSQLGSQLGFGTQMSGLSSQITELGIKQQRAQMISQLGFGAMNFGLSAQGQQALSGGYKGLTGRSLTAQQVSGPSGVGSNFFGAAVPRNNPFYG